MKQFIVIVHEDGTSVLIMADFLEAWDEELRLYDADGKCIAAFAQGTWRRAYPIK